MIEPVFWESHSRPALGDRAQAIINDQLVEDCDFAIGTFWTRLGTPTDVAESGTVEEIDQMRAAGKTVLLYFSAVAIELDSVDADEYARLKEYRESMQSQGLFFRYHDLAEFRKLVQRHLSQEMNELIAKHYASTNGTVKSAEPPSQRAVALATDVPKYARAVEAYIAAIRRLAISWRAERDSEPMGTDDGKRIVAEMGSEAGRLRAFVDDPSSEAAQILDETSKNARRLQRHRVYIDGGVSFAEFWRLGGELLTMLESVPAIVASGNHE